MATAVDAMAEDFDVDRLTTVLPEELLDACVSHLARTLDGPADLARLACTCRQLCGFILAPAFVARCGVERGHPGLASLSQLAVHEALTNIGTNRLVFEGADVRLRAGSLARCDEFASLMLRHSALTVSVEAHTGRNAPEFYAPSFTAVRAGRIANKLAAAGVDPDRISARGWGKVIAIAANWQPGIESARAELFFRLPPAAGATTEGLELPPRPAYYAGKEPPEPDDDFDNFLSDEDSDEEDVEDEYEDDAHPPDSYLPDPLPPPPPPAAHPPPPMLPPEAPLAVDAADGDPRAEDDDSDDEPDSPHISRWNL